MSLSLEQAIELIPELEELKGLYENNAWHDHDQVYMHVMKVIKEVKRLASNNLALHFAALLHDIGKIETFKKIDGLTICLNHESVGAKKAEKILKRLKFSKEFINNVVILVKLHGLATDLKKNDQLRADYPEQYKDLMIIGLADTLSCQLRTKDPQDFKRRIKFYQQVI